MAISDPNRIFDVFVSTVSGVDGGRLPHLIEKDRVAEGENAIFREGLPMNRPPFRDIELNFLNPNLTYDSAGNFVDEDGFATNQSRNAFLNGIFQEASYYNPAPGQEYFMLTVGGRYYRFQPKPGEFCDVREIVLARRNNAFIPINYHLQAGVYHLVQDGENSPIIYDGSVTRRATDDEIFTGLMMAQGQGRIVFIGLRGEVFFGDLRDGRGNGDADMLGMTETKFLAEGGPSAIPSRMGFPTAIEFLASQDTATGVGECLVAGSRGVESFFLSLPRETWKASQFQRSALLGIGVAGHRCMPTVNQNLWFRDPKKNAGWRNYKQARAQVDQDTQVPFSTEVRRWIDSETPELLKYCSAISFNSRLITTVTPYANGGRVYHNGLLSLDFDVISSYGKSSPPAWDGHWSNNKADAMTGLKVTRLVSGMFGGEERAFMFYLNGFGQNAMREIMPLPVGRDTAGLIKSSVITRAMDCSDPFQEKKLYDGDLWMTHISEPTTVTASYRPDSLPALSPWRTFAVNPVGDPNAQDPGFVPVAVDGFAPRRSLGKPSNDGDAANTKRIKRRGYRHQFKLEWTGRARLQQFRIHAQQEVEDSKAKV